MFQWVSQVPIQSWSPTGLQASSSHPHCCSLLCLTSSSASACRSSGLWWSRSSHGIPRPIYKGRAPFWDSGYHRVDSVGQVCLKLLISLTAGLMDSCSRPCAAQTLKPVLFEVPKLSSNLPHTVDVVRMLLLSPERRIWLQEGPSLSSSSNKFSKLNQWWDWGHCQ